MKTGEAAIEVRGLSKTYKGGKIRALDCMDLTVRKGEILGLIGPNGAGKTTLLGCLLALLSPDEGSIRINGFPQDAMEVRRSSAYMPERVDFEHWMTAVQFLEFHYGLAGAPRQGREAAIREALSTVRLDPQVWNRRLRTYSRGMLQRLNLAQTLLTSPEIAFLDEPTLGLDPVGMSVVRSVISRMKSLGITAIINSHQLDEVERLCDRVAFIKEGRIASIESLHAEDRSGYVLYVRWSLSQLNGTLASVASEAATVSGASIKDLSPEWGRFHIEDRASAVSVVKELVARGVPVEAAVPERGRLERLFDSLAVEGCRE